MIGAYNKWGSVQFPRLIDCAPWPWSQEVDADWSPNAGECLKSGPVSRPRMRWNSAPEKDRATSSD